MENNVERFVRRNSVTSSTVASSVAAELLLQNESTNTPIIGGNHFSSINVVNNNYFARPLEIYSESSIYSERGSIMGSAESLFQSDQPISKKIGRIIRRNKYLIGAVLICFLAPVTWFIISKLKNDHTWKTPYSMTFVKRDEWMRGEKKKLLLPIKRILIVHTADHEIDDTCQNLSDCISRVKDIQRKFMYLQDIPYNFVIGGDGSIIEGRGFYYEGEHTSSPNGSEFNSIGICVAFVGTFSSSKPTDEQKEAFYNFTQNYIGEGLIDKNFKVFLQYQLVEADDGGGLWDYLNTLNNFYPGHHDLYYVFKK